MRYTKKPITVDAFKWTGGSNQAEDPDWILEAMKNVFDRVRFQDNTIALASNLINLHGEVSPENREYLYHRDP